MRKSISALQAYINYKDATREYAVQSEKTIKNLQSCVESLKTTNREMKSQLDIATDLGDKRWKECERLRKALESLRNDERLFEPDRLADALDIIDAALRGEG